jgi:DNA-directed RNA polymerase subunit beta'
MFPEKEIQKITNKIEKKLDEAVGKIFPVDGKKHTLKLEEVKFGKTKALNSLKKQRDLKLKNRSLTIPVRAHLTLWDNLTGEKIDDKTVKIMRLPALTQRYTYLVDGNEYQAANQLRLKAGAYTKFANNGELQTQINVGNKPGFKIKMDPEDQILYLSARSSNISLYAFLKGMGIKDSYMEQFFGKEILETNRREKEHRSKQAVKNFGKKVAYSDEKGLDKIKEDVKKYFEEAEMDKETTEITLGRGFDKVNADMILHAAQKLIKVMQNKEEEDDRDSLVFKKYLSIEDHLAERIDKSVDKIKRGIEYNVDNHEEIKKIVSPNSFNDPIKSFFTSSDITAATEITNPLAALGNYRKVTIMGEGGISSPNQLSDDMININPSQLGFLDPVHTPESQKIGANLHLGVATDAEDGELKTRVINAKSGKVEKINPRTMSESVIAFPDQYDKKKKKFKNDKIKAMVKKEIDEVTKGEVDYILLSDKSMFDHTTNMIPFLQNTQGNRAMMGGKMQEQALSLKNREAPLVQSSVTEGGSTFEESLGNNNAIKAPVAGEITSLDPLTIKKGNGDKVEIELYDHFPLGGSSMVNHEVNVKVGDKVQKGELLADSNFTRDGSLALGTNLNVGFMPYKGYTFEDGLVITESAANKMTSEHLYTFEFEKDTNTTMDKDKFHSLFPKELDSENYQKLDDSGVITKGKEVKDGDKLLVALRKKTLTEADTLLKNIHKNLAPDQAPFTIEWDNENKGTVNEVVRNGNLIKIIVETEEKSKEGDKIVGRYGNKGTISKIIPDSEAPHNEEGKPLEIILNPHTVPSRMNPSQLLETAAGKIADKTGKPYKIDNFSGEDYLEKIKKDLKKHGLSEKEKIIDPIEGEIENPIFTGKQYFLKLKHQTKKKFSSRAIGEGYDENEQPIQGGKSSGQSMDILTNYTLLAHGAKHNLKEMSTLKGQKNDEFWRNFQVGGPLPELQTPFVFDKFIDELKGLGVNVKKGEKHYQLMAMTDSDIEEMSNGEIDDATIVRAKDLKEEKGGLFDPDITGGLDTQDRGKWSHINLEEPIPNPVFKKPITSILGITQKKFDNVLAGNDKLNGETGGKAIKEALSNVDIDEAVEEAKREKEQTKSAAKKDRLNKKIRYLKALKKTGKKPEDYVLTKMPILPPRFRPVYELPNGSLNVSDVNELYKHTILVNKALKQDKKLGLLDEKELGNMRKELFNSMEAVQGLSDPITNDAVRRGKKGILREIGGTSGTQPKNAFFQNRVMRKRQDLTGRSIIVAGPDLDIDTIGLPEEMAWNIFKPQVIRKLTQEGGIPGAQARDEHWEKRSDTAKKVLREVAEDTPVILNRAPSLHKFSTMAFKPKLIEGKSIQLPSLVTGGFNADFDGDTMAVHVPVSEEAKKEAFEKMLPSKNLFRPGHNNFMYTPGHEQILGLYYLTKDPKGDPERSFATKSEAVKTYQKAKKNKEKWSKEAPIEVGGEKMTIGKIIVNQELPKEFRKYDGAIDKKYLKDMFVKLGEDEDFDNSKLADIANELKNLGNEHIYKRGFTVGISDLDINKKKKDKIYDKAKKEVEKAKKKPKKQAQKEIAKIMNKAEKEVYKTITEENPDNAFVIMQRSGARGNEHNVRQILGGPGILADNKNEIVPVPVTKSYGEGIDTADYWTTMYGARKGMIDRAKSTAEPGAFNKELINNTLDHLVTEKDCGTHQGKTMPIYDKDAKNRYLAESVRSGGKIVAHRNDLLNYKLLKELKKMGVTQVKLRTPLKCEASEGLCSKCYGAFADGQEPEVGDNIGIIAGEAMTEPTTQMTMNAFHSGGVMSNEEGKAQGMERLQQIFHMPKTVKGKATLSNTSGVISKIESTATGKEVYVNGKKHFIPNKRKVIVKKGDSVKKGDRLCSGVIKPQELMDLKGLDSVREYLTDELSETYGGDIHKPTIETVVQKVTNLTKINDPGDSNFMEGQFAPLNKVESINRQDNLSVDVEDAIGKTLAENIGGMSEGSILTPKMVDKLKQSGNQKVKIKHKKINHSPELKGINQLPYYREDWMSKMNVGDIPRQFAESASQGLSSKYKDTNNPIPAFAHGASFGQGDKY